MDTAPLSTAPLTELAHQHLERARSASSGRSAHTVHGGRDHVLRQTLIALASGQLLHEHENPGEATVQVLLGRVALAWLDVSHDGVAGDLLVVPDHRHSLEALEDAVVLLTVAVRH